MSHLSLVELLAPLSDDRPCGEDLEYDPAFVALEEAARGKPEQQFGDTVIAPQDPNWREVFEQAQTLSHRTRDLRLVVLMARAGAHLHGLSAYGQALGLIAALLESQWPSVYPALDADDNNDPTMRLNALAPLVDMATGLADLRCAVLGQGRLALNVRQLELASGKVDPLDGESVPTLEGIAQALRDAQGQDPELFDTLRQPLDAIERIEAVLAEQAGGVSGPDLSDLRRLAHWLAHVADQAEGGQAAAPVDPAEATAPTQSMGGQPSAAPGAIRTRDDAVRALERVCEWIEHNEPTNPAPLLIRRAQRLMGKNFLEIIRDLAPESLAQIENIAGASTFE